MQFHFEEACKYVGLSGEAQYKLEVKYREAHRFYHNINHINEILIGLHVVKSNFSEYEFSAMVLAALYHDAIYEPGSISNEIRSCEFMVENCKDIVAAELLSEAIRLIKLTTPESNHYTDEEDYMGMEFLKQDLAAFYGSFAQFTINSQLLFKEFQAFDLVDWQKGRLTALQALAEKSILRDDAIAQTNIEFEIEREKAYSYKIGLFAGSFNPFHAGHMNILRKAEKVFDKVIIGFATNHDKPQHKIKVPRALKYHQVEPIESFLTEFIDSKPYDITLIRGLRNTADMIQELNQYRHMQEMAEKKVNIMTIFCDKEYEHVSSSSLRNIQKIGTTLHPSYLKYIID